MSITYLKMNVNWKLVIQLLSVSKPTTDVSQPYRVLFTLQFIPISSHVLLINKIISRGFTAKPQIEKKQHENKYK